MSSQQVTLDDLEPTSTDGADSALSADAWAVGNDESVGSNRQCENCGAHVTPQFARTYGDRENCVHACPECTPKCELKYAANGRARRLGLGDKTVVRETEE